MSENADQGPGSRGGDWGEYDLDASEQLEADINLDDPSAGNDEPWSPPDRQPRGAELIGVDTDGGESFSQRLMQEEPEFGTAYGAPDNDEVEMIGGDDPDAIPADQDVYGGGVEPGSSEGPESGAMHVIDEDEEPWSEE